MPVEKLSAMRVSKLAQPGRYGDGGGLWLQVSKWGTKAWLLRYAIAGRQRQMGLGGLDDVTLAEARQAAREARRQLREGLDPIEVRRSKVAALRADDAKTMSFQQCAEAYIASHRAGWRSPKHADQWLSTLTTYAFPTFGHLPVAAVDVGLVLKAIEPIWTTKPETAGRVRGRIESVLSWAIARGHRAGPNPASWRGHLDRLLPAKAKVKRVRHHPAMPVDDVPGFLAELRAKDFISARALEFTILTASRTGEVIGAQWAEIDISAGVWSIPAERMKAARPHRVALSSRAVEILKSLPREDEGGDRYVFPGAREHRGLSNMSLLEALRGLRPDAELTVHGFRSSFRDWAAERTSFASEVVEMALAHTVADRVEAAYRRGDLLEKRRRLAEAWSRFCLSDAAGRGRIVGIGEGRRHAH
jgi:integrase